MIGLYIVLAPLLFFRTLGSAHKAMRASKERYLDTISKKFQATYSQMNTFLNSDAFTSQPERLKTYLDQLQQLDTLHKRTDAFPIWPFDTGSLFRFLRAFSVSLAPALVSVAIKISGISIGIHP